MIVSRKNGLFIIMVLAVIMSAMTGCTKETKYSDYEKISLSASWSYNYASVEELSGSSDLIAVISIKEAVADDDFSGVNVLMTKYTATVKELIYGDDSEEIQIVMTGGIDHKEKKIYEITDDPLMNEGDEFLVFAKKNKSGTYTILSGSQGRFLIENNKVYSLNIANEQVKNSNKYSNIVVDGTEKDRFLDTVIKSVE